MESLLYDGLLRVPARERLAGPHSRKRERPRVRQAAGLALGEDLLTEAKLGILLAGEEA
jgi:hypothetical protein